MKIAVSVDDGLLIEADRAACEIGVGRSRLFSMALESYLAARRDRKILDQLNEAYVNEPTAEEKRIVSLLKEKFRTRSSREVAWL